MIVLEKYRPDWEYKRLQFGALILNSSVDKKIVENEIPVKLCNYVDVYKNDIITESLDFMDGSATQEEINKFSICAGDVIITKDSESPDDIGIPAFVEKNLNGVVCGYHLAILKPFENKLNGRFLSFFLNSRIAQTNFELGSNGVTRFGLSRNAIKTLQIPIPKYEEQTLIARYLDQKTGQIDRLIEQKEKLLKLLAEKRTAIITQAVTKGLDPTVEMKDSGIDWLGCIPEHWEVSKIGYDFDIQLGKMVQPEPKSAIDEYLPYLRAANIQWQGPDLTSVKSMWFSPSDKKKFSLRYGDLLISEGGDVGRSCIWNSNEEFYFQNALNRARFNGRSNIDFLFYWLHFLKQCGYIDVICNSSTISHFTAEKVKAATFIKPNLIEQLSIVTNIKVRLRDIDNLSKAITLSVIKLKEYREALITAAVTGQIDVRKEITDE